MSPLLQTPEDKLADSVTLSNSPSEQAVEREKVQLPRIAQAEPTIRAEKLSDVTGGWNPINWFRNVVGQPGHDPLMLNRLKHYGGEVGAATMRALGYGARKLSDAEAADIAQTYQAVFDPATGTPTPDEVKQNALDRGAEHVGRVIGESLFDPSSYAVGFPGGMKLLGAIEKRLGTEATGQVLTDVARNVVPEAKATLDLMDARKAIEEAGGKFKGISEYNGKSLAWFDVEIPSGATTKMLPVNGLTKDQITRSITETKAAFMPAASWNRQAYEAALQEYRVGERVATAETRAKGELLARQEADRLMGEATPGHALNQDEAYAFVRMEELSSERLKMFADEVLQNPTDDAIRRMVEQIDSHLDISVRRQGGQATAGRALNIFNDPTASSVKRIDETLEALKNAPADSNATALAARILSAGPDQRVKMLDGASGFMAKGKTVYDAMTSAWYNSILSHPVTHIANVLENALRLYVVDPLAKLGPAALRYVPQQFGLWQKGERFSEAWAAARTVWNPLTSMRALEKAAADFKAWNPHLDLGKLQSELPRVPLDEAVHGLTEEAPALSWGTRVWAAINTPTRFLASEDNFFKIVARQVAIEEHATRAANDAVMRAGVSGDGAVSMFRKVYEDFRANPTPVMDRAAEKYGQYIGYQTPLGPTGQKFQDAVNAVPFLGKAVFPFIRTPIDIGKATWEHIPGTLALSSLSSKYRAAHLADPIERNVLLGRQAMGATIGGAAAWWASTGNMRGSIPPEVYEKQVGVAESQNQRGMTKTLHLEPHQTRIPGTDTWIRHDRLGMIGKMLSLSADAALVFQHLSHDEDADTIKTLTQAIGAAWASLVMDPTYSKGVRDIFGFAADPIDPRAQEGVRRWAEDTEASVVPGIVQDVRKITDPTIREAAGLLDRVKNRLPGFSADLPPKYDVLTGKKVDPYHEWYNVLGNPLRGEAPAEVGKVPGYVEEMWRLGMKEPYINRSITTFDGIKIRPVEMDPAERNEIVRTMHSIEIGGKKLGQALTQMVNDRRFQKLPDDDPGKLKQNQISSLFAVYEGEARRQMVMSGQYPDLSQKVREEMQRTMQIRQGAQAQPTQVK